MNRQAMGKAVGWLIIGAAGVLWAIKPSHPLVLKLLCDVVGVCMFLGWIVWGVAWFGNWRARRNQRPGRF